MGFFGAPFLRVSINRRIGKKMNILDQKTDKELEQSMLAEVAKASSELRCARQDLEKATNRLSFVLVLANTLINRTKD